ncbi:MAG: hypothetical protein ABI743_14925 [bacterium]
MTANAPATPVRKAGAIAPMDRIALVFPVLAALGLGGMAWLLQVNSANQLNHPSVGVFHSGEMATENGITGTVEVLASPAPMGQKWHLKLSLLDQEANPITDAEVKMHGVEGERYLDPEPLPAGEKPGTWEGDILLTDDSKTVMVHVNVPGGPSEEWVAEWTPPGGENPHE